MNVRRRQFSLRTLLLLMVVVAIGLTLEVRRQRVRRAVSAIRCGVIRDQSTLPWLRSHTPELLWEYVDPVIGLDINLRATWDDPGTIVDADLLYLRDLPDLEAINLHESHFSVGNYARVDLTDGALKHVASLRRLRQLDVSGSRITDAGLPQLYGLQQLEELHISMTHVTDSGLRKLQLQLPRTKVIRHRVGFD